MVITKKTVFESYVDVRDWLEGFIPLVYGKEELGLSRIENLLALLGNPEKKFKSIHVAGTSGKGSTAFLAAKLLSSKLTVYGSQSKVGLHISPHLVDIRERMQIFENRESRIKSLESSSLVPMGRFLRLFSEIRPVVEKVQKEKPELTPSYFEILVAASFKYFAEEKVDWAVVEVGLGGRLDATNVLIPEVSVITNIGLDHTEILGDTVEKIAAEKAGIIKPGVPVVTAAKGSALRVIEKVARERGAEVVLVSGSRYLVSGKEKKPKNAQNLNFEIAQKAVEVALSLQQRSVHMIAGSNLKRDRYGHQDDLAMTMDGLPGRFEEIDEAPTSPGGLRGVKVLLDGAHNPDKIRSLIEFVRELKVESGKWKVVLVLAFKKGKNWQEMIDLLFKNLSIQSVIATEFQAVTDTGRFGTVPAEEIRDYVEKVHSAGCKVIRNSQEAVFEAIQTSVIASGAKQSELEIASNSSNPRNDGLLVIVTGSLYLVGEVRTMWHLPSFA